ncbi:MAG: hypothetical protein ISS77_01945 [Phycisphaerae bacterium]|nr:hypothetical protein [Phycisphaerae bacterium]
MDKPKLKGVTDIFSYLKDYSSLVIPIVILIVGVVFLILGSLGSKKLNAEIEGNSIRKLGKTIQSLEKNAVPAKQVDVERKFQDAFEKEATELSKKAIETTQRELLSYEMFPEPKDISTFIFQDFGNKYREAVLDLVHRVNGRDCPTPIEIDNELEISGGKSRVSKTIRSSKTDIKETIIDALCVSKADSASVYVTPEEINGYLYFEKFEFPDKDRAIEDCWYWQNGYWVIEDIFDSIKAINQGSESIDSSKVKRLLGINFDSGKSKNFGRSRRGSKSVAVDSRPSYVMDKDTAMTYMCTGRVCNEDYDIVHFSVEVIISAEAIPEFMKVLCSAKEHKFRDFDGKGEEQSFVHNQITVLENSIIPVDRKDKENELYRYGQAPIFRLSLICEYLFNKAGYEQIKPQKVKDYLLNHEGEKGKKKKK